ncbi:MAG: transposase [Comamonadaceae bacterium]|nr:MAG: transposase [Comamonadaceae bacterium]
MSTHDNAYKHLFSHPEAVRDLLRGFVVEDWVALLDFDTLQKVSSSYVSDDLRDREDDIIWRIRMENPSSSSNEGDTPQQGEWVYVYLLLEFQSTVDNFMAVRILTYIGLLYQDLIKSGQVKGQTKLPPVFPLVLYNGVRPWNAEREIEQLIEPVPASLGAYRPRLRYFLMDEGRVSEDSLQQNDNPIASLMQIERALDPTELGALFKKLLNQLKAPQNTNLRRACTVWFNRIVLRRFDPTGDLPEIQDLSEVQHMIGERIDIWKEQLIEQGMLAGKLEGKLEGMHEGVQQGMQQGKLEGQAELLRRFLIRRFGILPVGVEAQISAASLEQIESWFDRSMDAPSLGVVFTQH